ncbi:MAG: hypothetical protein WC718_10040 [Phycisphaerales bacterium]|jgi:hypothetical protein
MSDTPRDSGQDGARDQYDLYVGYLPVPRRYVKFVRVVVPVTLWVLAMLALGWASRQGDPGGAVWEDEAPKTFAGTIVSKPYPLLLEQSDGGSPGGNGQVVGGVTPRLIVEGGKHGGQRAAPFDQQFVMVRGYRLTRDGREIIELAEGKDAIAPAQGVPRTELKAAFSGLVTLRGEIVDSKCYLGAMKPGEGKTHKACASLCVRGGIPPMLVTLAPDGTLSYTIIAKTETEPVGEEILEYVGDEVIVQGQGFELGGIRFIGVANGSIRRP